MLRNGHVRFGGRPAETHPAQARQGAAGRPYTYVRTWAGFAYVAFVTDVYSRKIVGWNVAPTLRADILPLQALDMAAWNAGDLAGLIHHADHGSNYMSIVYTDRVVELGAVPSTGTVGDSFDCQSLSARSREDGVVLAGVF